VRVLPLQVLNLVDIHDNSTPWRRLPLPHHPTTNNDGVDIPFYFQIPQQTYATLPNINGVASDIQSDPLPSSLSMAPSRLSDSAYMFSFAAATKVVYEVKAFALKNNEVLTSRTQEIRLFTSSPAAPPSCPSDFTVEYRYSQSKSLRTKFFQKIADLVITTEEPQPLEFSTSQANITTSLPLSFKLLYHPQTQNRSTFSRLSANLLTLDVSVTWKLKSLTVIAVQRLPCIPPVAQSRETTSVARVVTLSPASSCKLRLRDWKSSEAIENDGLPHKRVQSYTHENSIWLSIPGRQPNFYPTPTFSTPYLFRRYSFTIHVEASGSLGKAAFDLEVPVQIVYRDGTPSRIDAAHSTSETRARDGESGDERNVSGRFLPEDMQDGGEAAGEWLPPYVP
jgi:hypothetical protein